MSNWPTVKLGDVCEDVANKKPSGEFFDYIDIDAIDNKAHRIHTPKHLPVAKAPGRAIRGIQEGDTLFSLVRPYLENIAFVTDEYKDCIASSGFLVCRPKQSMILPQYLFHVLLSPIVLNPLATSMSGFNSPSVHKEDVFGISIPLPPLAEQRAIVARLEKELATADEAVVHFTELADTAESEFKATLAETFTSLDCETVRLGDVCEINRGVVISKKYLEAHKGSYPVYSSQTKENGIFGHIDSYAYDGEYLTWTTDGANAGSVFYHNEKFSITNVCGLLHIVHANLNAKFLLYFLRYDAKRYVNRSMGNPKLMSNVVAKIPIPLPPLAEQRAIVARLTAAVERRDKIVELARRAAETAATWRKAILKEAFQ